MFTATFSISFAALLFIFVGLAVGGFVRHLSDNSGVVAYYCMWVGFAGTVFMSAMFGVNILLSI